MLICLYGDYAGLSEYKALADSTFSAKIKYLSTLQKQVGCFNHRVVALVAGKLEREVCFDVED